MEIKKVTLQEGYDIINNRKPKGLFFIKMRGYIFKKKWHESAYYIAIDNKTGDGRAKTCGNLWSCKKWLLGPAEAMDETET